MIIFNGHSDLWEDVDEKRTRGLSFIIESFHRDPWRKGNVQAGFYPIWVNPDSGVSTQRQAVSILSHMAEELRESRESVRVVTDYAGLLQALERNQHGILLGSEGLSYIGADAGLLELLYLMGFRTASLTWNEDNLLASGAGGAQTSGLTAAGTACVKKMEKMGMLLDLAHAGGQTFWDSVGQTEAPFIVSHGNCKALCEHPRNYDDRQLKALAERGGVIGVNAYAPFVSADRELRTIEQLANHIDYMVDLIGIDHVGFGFDLVNYLDDYGTDPTISEDTAGFETIERTPELVRILEERGYSGEALEKICSGNFLRVIHDVIG